MHTFLKQALKIAAAPCTCTFTLFKTSFHLNKGSVGTESVLGCANIACRGWMQGCAPKAARRLLACWGNTDAGRLGHGAAATQCLFPRVVAALLSQEAAQDVARVACGGAHTAVVTGLHVR